MGKPFHQKIFFPFENGAPNVHSLRANSSKTRLLVTTDRSVHVLHFDTAQKAYIQDEIEFLDESTDRVEVIASGFIECPGRERVVVAYAEVGGDDESAAVDTATGDSSDKLFLSVIDPRARAGVDESPRRKPTLVKMNSSGGEIESLDLSSSIRFELVAAPTVITSVHAKSLTTSGVHSEFHGVILFRMESVVAIGFVDEIGGSSPSAACVRLSNEQFASFFPDFAQLTHPVLTVDTLRVQGEERSWLALGCADGFIRVFSGSLHENELSGPFEVREMHMQGPVLSVSLFTCVSEGRRVCNLVAACAVGHAVVYEDIFGQTQEETVRSEVLTGSDQFDTVFSALAADIDLDGETELLVGTDHQSLLAYKHQPTRPTAIEKDDAKALRDGPPSSRGVAGGVDAAKTESPKWVPLPPTEWQMRAFGGIYSLAWLDLNRDGVRELAIASSTGVYIYEADPVLVLQRLEALVEAAISPNKP